MNIPNWVLLMSEEELLETLDRMSDKEREKLYCNITGMNKRSLIETTMTRFGIQFEPAEHIVEIAIGDRDLNKLSLAEVSGLIVNVGNSLVKQCY